MSADAATKAQQLGESAPAVASRDRIAADLKTVPNILSVLRILGVLAGVMLYLHVDRMTGLIVGFSAGATDILDGWLARKLDQVTELGALLDRLSDLVFEGAILSMMVLLGLIPLPFLLIYLTREFIVLTGRIYVAERGGKIPTSLFGKIKTDFFSLSFLLMMTGDAGVLDRFDGLPELAYKISFAGIAGGLLFSLISGYLYMRTFVAVYREHNR